MKLHGINVSSTQRSENGAIKDGAVKIKTAQVIFNAGLKLCVPVRSSFVCGLAGALASNPVDVVRTRMMNQRGGALYQGTLDCLLQVSNTAVEKINIVDLFTPCLHFRNTPLIFHTS